MQNQGNAPLVLRFRGRSPGVALRFHFEPATLQLAPGETRYVRATIRPAHSAPSGQRIDQVFAIVAESQDAAHYYAPLAGRFSYKPSWPLWLAGLGLPLVAVLFLLIVAGVGAVLIGYDLIELPFPGGATTQKPPAQTVIITVTPSDASNAAGATLIPTPVEDIVRFEADPPEVTYRSRGEVTLSWEASGAARITLFDSTGQELRLSAAELSTNRVSIPIEDLVLGEQTFRLTVTGADGQPRSQDVLLAVRAWACAIDPARAPFYTRPDPASDVAPLPQTSDVVISGRTSDALWLQVLYNDGSVLGWTPAWAVTCQPGSQPLDEYVIMDVASALPPPRP